MEEEQKPLYPYAVEVKIGGVKKTLRIHARDDEDARERALARYQILSVKRDTPEETGRHNEI